MLIGLVTVAWILVLMAAPMLVVAGARLRGHPVAAAARSCAAVAPRAPPAARPTRRPTPSDLVWAHARRRFDALRERLRRLRV